ncbi:GNAT family N-acetyltransferase [Dyella caseinilytica]|uniref:GNAT family N-acetyltransferase n=1 Tax=Dyella caseinilytica TaxID=1849581 RepID=A0ABX7GUJ8_9GAMM|nr:GNAT family N-acetyltransferase [Dyella caseinilytica]QRN53686.1 GNAT family N-acetyltransferase [Dyella caseinilytica]GFZ88512.1 N-acetyltransferase [Dyella caseinilytica]
MGMAVAPFPVQRHDALAYVQPLAAHGMELRLATLDDLPFMRELYGQLRAGELDQVDWPEQARRAFLDSQFQLQHQHFVTYFSAADFYVVVREGVDIGRFYLLSQSPYFLVIDIALLPAWRNGGLGAALLAWAKQRALDSQAQGVDLHVDERNLGAKRLYTRQGFQHIGAEGPYLRMRWEVPSRLN